MSKASSTHFGAGHPAEVHWGRLVRDLIPSAERVRFVSSGTEATMMCLHIARAYTGKRKIIRFAHHFHGWNDHVASARVSSGGEHAAGIVPGIGDDLVILPDDDGEALREAFRAHADIAGAIIEPTGASFVPAVAVVDSAESGPVRGVAPLKHTGEPFGGAGVLAQWSTAKEKGFRLPTWMTFSAVREHGGRLLGGAVPVTVFHGYTRPAVTVSAETGEGVVRTAETWRPYTVFNVEEVAGLPRHLYRSYREIRPASHPSPEDGLDDFVQTLGADPHLYDRVGGPALVQQDYRHTGIVREVVMWRGHPARLNRQVEDEIVDAGMSLAGEELVCEIATVFLSADLGVRMYQGSGAGRTTADGWCRLLTGDEMAIFRACRDTSRTVDWLHRRAPGFRIDPAMAQTRVVLSGTGAEMAASPVGVSAVTGSAGAVGDVALLVAARDARLFAGEACVFRARVAAGSDAAGREQEAGRLLAAADKVDLETPVWGFGTDRDC